MGTTDPDPNLVALSFAQQRLWFLDQLEPNTPLYNIPTLARITGRLNLPALEQALNAIVARHEILRTRIVCHEDIPSQLISESERLKIQWVDWTAGPNQTEAEIQQLVRGRDESSV